MAALPVPAQQPSTMNYQFGTFRPEGTAVVAGGDTAAGATKEGSTAPTFNLGAAGSLGTGMRPTVAGTMPGSNPNVPDVNPNNPTYVPTVGGGTAGASGAGTVAAPTFTSGGGAGAPSMSGGPQGEYNDTFIETVGGKDKFTIAPEGAYDIGPYYGYAFDAGNRSLQTGYDTASQLAAAGTQAAALGVGAGQQVGQVAQGYGDMLTKTGFQAQEASNQYEQALRGYATQSAQGAQTAQQIGAAGQAAAQQAGAAMGTQGGKFVQQGAAAGTQNIADVNLKASQQALGQSAAYANQLAGIGAQPGPSAAQAQLQSALNQSQQANLAMARSGRGWGGSASAQSQALAANAAAGQQAVNASAQLRAQEEQQRLAMLSSNVGQAAQLQQAGAQTALSQQQLAAQTNLQEAQVQAQRQQALYQLGLQSQQQGAELGLQGAGLALQGQQAYQAGLGQAGQMSAQAAQTDLASRQAYLQALSQGGALATQGLQAGGELGLQGIGQGAGLYAQGQQFAQGSELQAMQFAAQQQHAEQAYVNAVMQQYGIQKGVAIQQQQATNQLIGAGAAAAATLGPLLIGASDRRLKTDIEPLETKNYALDFRPSSEHQPMPDFGLSQASHSQPLADFGLSQAKNPAADAQASAQTAATQDKFKAAGAGLGGSIQNFMAPTQTNPLLAQSLQNVGAGGVMSDRSTKRDIEELDAAGSDAVRAIQGAPGMAAQAAFEQTPAYSYQYKQPEKYGEGEFIGLMANDLAKSPAGATVVSTMPNGKLAVDTQRLAMLTAAAQSQTQEQTATLEEKLARLQRRVLSQQSYADGTY